jgi:phosphohistidine phosphatase SixA
MPETSFFICLSTSDTFEGEEYTKQAGRMSNIFTEIFTNSEKILLLTHKAPLTGCHTELDVSQDETGLKCAAVVDFTSSKKVTIDKTKLSKMLKAEGKWSNMKVEKKVVPEEPEPPLA